MSGAPARPARLRAVLCLVLAGLIAGAGLAACGKRGSLEPPEGEEGAYTYPRFYPAPSTVLPPEEPEARPRSRQAPSHAGDLSPFPQERETTTYGEPAAP